MSEGAAERPREAGISLVEVIVAMVIFSIVGMSALQHGFTARQQSRAGEIITEVAAIAQYQFETLRGMDFDSVASDADTINGYATTWTVTGVDPKTVVLVVNRPSVLGAQVADSFVTIVHDWGS